MSLLALLTGTTWAWWCHHATSCDLSDPAAVCSPVCLRPGHRKKIKQKQCGLTPDSRFGKVSPLWLYCPHCEGTQRGQGVLIVDMYAQPPAKNTFLMGLTDPKDAWPLSDLLWDMRNVCSSLCALLCNSVRQFHFPYILINKAQLFTICQTNIPSICQIILISSSSLCHDVGAVFTPVLQSWKLKHWEVSTLVSHENSIMNDEMYVLNNSVVIV